MDLLHRLTGEQPLTAQETARLMISRDQFAAFWRILDRHLKQGKLETDLLPYLRSLAAQVGGCDSFLRAALALTVFQERDSSPCPGRRTGLRYVSIPFRERWIFTPLPACAASGAVRRLNEVIRSDD